MTHKLSDKPSVVTVPFRQTVSKAGEIGSVTEDTSTWLPLENGLNIKDGKLALSTSTSTVVTNAQTLYPQLWANTPSAWKSGSHLTIPAIQDQGYSEWIDVTTEMNSTGKPENTGIVGDGTYSYYYYRLGTKSLDVKFRWVGASAGSGTTNILIPLPSGQEFGFSGITTSISQNGLGSCLTVNIDHANPTTSDFANTSFNYNAGDEKLRIIKLGTTQGLRGDDLLVNSQLQGEVNVIIDQSINRSTPYIQLFDDVAASVIGLPEATADVSGIVTRNQVTEAGRNYIINGGFDFWQRGTSHSTEGYGSVDRFRLGLSGGACTVSRQAFTSNQTDVPGFPKYFLRFDATSGNDSLRLDTRLEDLRNFAGKTWTLSFWAKGTNPGGGSLYTTIDSRYGAAGTNFAFVSNEYQVSAIWQKFTFTFTVPDLDGTALDDTGCLIVNLINQSIDASTAAYQVDIAQVKLEEGSQATKFTRAGGTYAGEERLCYRYYYTPDDARPVVFSSIATAASQRLYTSVDFPVRMRANPTVVRTPQSENNCTFSSLSFARETGFYLDYLSDGAGVCSVFTDYAADAEI